MVLKAKKPEPTQERLKMFIYGDKGVGKTTAAMQFPNAFFVDMEKGTERYWKTMQEMGSDRLQTTSFHELSEQVKELSTTNHQYRTLVIDPITIAYDDLKDHWMGIFDKHAEKEKELEMKDYGMRYWAKVKFDGRRFRRLLTKLDTNIIATAHQKNEYENQKVIGQTYDSDSKDGYFFDFVFRVVRKGKGWMAYTEKKREDLGKPIFPDEFEWSYQNFIKFYGAEHLERAAKPIVLATPDQVNEITHLLENVKIDEETISKWFKKAEVDNFAEMTMDQVQGCIDFVTKKLQGATK